MEVSTQGNAPTHYRPMLSPKEQHLEALIQNIEKRHFEQIASVPPLARSRESMPSPKAFHYKRFSPSTAPGTRAFLTQDNRVGIFRYSDQTTFAVTQPSTQPPLFFNIYKNYLIVIEIVDRCVHAALYDSKDTGNYLKTLKFPSLQSRPPEERASSAEVSKEEHSFYAGGGHLAHFMTWGNTLQLSELASPYKNYSLEFPQPFGNEAKIYLQKQRVIIYAESLYIYNLVTARMATMEGPFVSPRTLKNQSKFLSGNIIVVINEIDKITQIALIHLETLKTVVEFSLLLPSKLKGLFFKITSTEAILRLSLASLQDFIFQGRSPPMQSLSPD